MKIRIGPAGTGGDSINGLRHVKELGLNVCEIEFTHGVNMSNETAKKVGALAKELGVKLSVHAPYFINLNSIEKKKLEASKNRILGSCERAHYLGAENVVFHPGFYGKLGKEETFNNIKSAIIGIQHSINEKGWKVKLAPETTGKINVFGDLSEILKLVKEAKCGLCIDFAHLKARNNGKISYENVIKELKGFNEVHCHMSGIEYTAKGEKRHLLVDKDEVKELAKAMLNSKINFTIINESPDIFGDAVIIKKVFENLNYNF